MIEIVAYEKFCKDVAHEPLRPIVPKDPRTYHTSSPPPAVAPTRTTHSGGVSSSSSSNSGFLKMFWGIFVMYHHTDQHMDVIEQRMENVHRNQEIIHSQRDESLLEFPNVPVYPPVVDPYASLTPAELVTFGIGPSYALAGSDDDDDEEEEAINDDEEMRTASRWRGTDTSLSLFPFCYLDANGEKIVISLLFFIIFLFPKCVMDLCSTCGGRGGQELIYVWLVKLFKEI
jgi:hypothetical protein